LAAAARVCTITPCGSSGSGRSRRQPPPLRSAACSDRWRHAACAAPPLPVLLFARAPEASTHAAAHTTALSNRCRRRRRPSDRAHLVLGRQDEADHAGAIAACTLQGLDQLQQQQQQAGSGATRL
jgi:hypothetical protein